MKWQDSASFLADLKRLPRDQREIFRRVVREVFTPACDAFVADPARPWPKSLRVKRVRGGPPGVFEMTWSFSGPDGRATFQFVTIDGELSRRWRRIGGHDIFRDP